LSCGKSHILIARDAGYFPYQQEPKMVLSSWMEDLAMTRSIIDTKFPYVLVCSTFGAIVSLASVWLVTSLTYAPTLVA
jgi:hypothetical protein